MNKLLCLFVACFIASTIAKSLIQIDYMDELYNIEDYDDDDNSTIIYCPFENDYCSWKRSGAQPWFILEGHKIIDFTFCKLLMGQNLTLFSKIQNYWRGKCPCCPPSWAPLFLIIYLKSTYLGIQIHAYVLLLRTVSSQVPQI